MNVQKTFQMQRTAPINISDTQYFAGAAGLQSRSLWLYGPLRSDSGAVDLQAATAILVAIEVLYSQLRARIIHLDKPEAARAPCIAVFYQFDRVDTAMIAEKIAYIVFI